MNITLIITECCISRCFEKQIQNCYNFTNLNQVINLQNGYTLTIIAIDGDNAYIKLENDNTIIYRILNINYPLQICLSNSNYFSYHLTINLVLN